VVDEFRAKHTTETQRLHREAHYRDYQIERRKGLLMLSLQFDELRH